MAKILVMNFLNEEIKKTSIRLNNAKENITQAEVSYAMDVIIAKNIFASIGGDLIYKDSAELTDENSTAFNVK